MPRAASNNGLVMNAVVSRRRAGRSATLVGAKPTLADRAVNPQLPPPCGFVDGAKRRRPQLHRANNRKTRLQLLLFNPLKSQKRLFSNQSSDLHRGENVASCAVKLNCK